MLNKDETWTFPHTKQSHYLRDGKKLLLLVLRRERWWKRW